MLTAVQYTGTDYTKIKNQKWKYALRVDSGNLPAGKLPGFTGILRLPLPDFVPKLPEFTVP